MMASKLAILLAAPSTDEDDNPDEDAIRWCDSQLQEVRECIAGLSYKNKCWCVNAEQFDGEPPRHHEHCQRAHQLAERLRVE